MKIEKTKFVKYILINLQKSLKMKIKVTLNQHKKNKPPKWRLKYALDKI